MQYAIKRVKFYYVNLYIMQYNMIICTIGQSYELYRRFKIVSEQSLIYHYVIQYLLSPL